ncbi:MAG TPA: hypothetical protein VFZ65_08185 [Planctomycetota bacterium]|nr:hypothetical protein [Planctomycetota bacterium]
MSTGVTAPELPFEERREDERAARVELGDEPDVEAVRVRQVAEQREVARLRRARDEQVALPVEVHALDVLGARRAAEQRRERHDGIDRQFERRVVLAEHEDDVGPDERVVARHFDPRAVVLLVDDRSAQLQVAPAQAQRDRTIVAQPRRCAGRDAQTQIRSFGAGSQHEVELEIALVGAVHEVDAGQRAARAQLAEVRHREAPPARILAEIVVAHAAGPLARLERDVAASADQFERRLAAAGLDDHLRAPERPRDAGAAGQELAVGGGRFEHQRGGRGTRLLRGEGRGEREGERTKGELAERKLHRGNLGECASP